MAFFLVMAEYRSSKGIVIRFEEWRLTAFRVYRAPW